MRTWSDWIFPIRRLSAQILGWAIEIFLRVRALGFKSCWCLLYLTPHIRRLEVLILLVINFGRVLFF